jgi:tetratricopeptide (TPR) repeat protein
MSSERTETGTRIDLGDDLIEGTETIETPAPDGDPRAIEASVENARILVKEGFFDEAKRILRQLLIRDSHDVLAHKFLEEIHQTELKQLFASSESTSRKSYTNIYDESILSVDSEKVFRSLDSEFDLHVESGAADKVFSQLDVEIAGAPPRDRMDLAISFMEMGLYAHAIQLLKGVMRAGEELEEAAALLAFAYLTNEEPFEAMSILQPLLNDTDIPTERKVEFYYLMARACETLHREPEALGWYLQAQQVDPDYRDVRSRILSIQGSQRRSRDR